MTSQTPKNDVGALSTLKPFAGHNIAFTGTLESMRRREAFGLVERLGGVPVQEVTNHTTMLIVGSKVDRRKSKKFQKAENVNLRTPGSIIVLSEEEFCRASGRRSNESLKRLHHGLRQIRELYPLIREEHLRHLHKWRLVRPVVRTNFDTYYSFADVAVLRRVHEELVKGVSFRYIVRGLLTEREGQRVFDFGSGRGDTSPAKIISLFPPTAVRRPKTSEARGNTETSLAAQFFLEGSELDEGPDADQERARVAYRKALMLEPELVPALVNLANIHYAHNDLVEAQALYERALNLDGECFEASFNLGNIYHDLGRYESAAAYYRDALQIHEGYADAHFYLAVTLEKMGRSEAAKPHWRLYQQFAPNGEWVELAREFSE